MEIGNCFGRRLALGDDEVQRVWKDYFENLYDTDTQEQVAFYMYSVEGIQKVNQFKENPIRKTEVEVRVGKLKNGKAEGKDEVTEEMIMSGGNIMVN